MRKSLTALIVGTCMVSNVQASDVYRYRDNMPLAEMMLKMMDLFGIVDRIPDPYLGTYGDPRYDNLRYRNTNNEQLKFMRYLQMVQSLQNPGSNPGGFGDPLGSMNPLGFTGMGSNPLLSGMGTNPFSSLNGFNNMGNMANLGNLSGFNPGNPLARYSNALPQPPRLMEDLATSLPGGIYTQNGYSHPSSAYPPYAQSPYSSPGARSSAPGSSTSVYGLDGRWRNANNELLMISKDRFVWENPAKGRNLMGFMQVDGNRITAHVSKMNSPIRFNYVLDGNGNVLNVIDPGNGQRYRFMRVPVQ